MRCRECKKSITPIDKFYTAGLFIFCCKEHRQEFISKQKEKENKKKAKQRLEDRKVKKREKKENSNTTLSKKLWKIVSEYIRRRDSNEYGIGTCCTCGIQKHRKQMQAGHYLASGNYSYHRYNDKNIHMQCYGCNCGKHGNVIEYRQFMISKYGEKFVEQLENTRHTIKPVNTEELKELIQIYTLKLKEIGKV